MGLVLGIRTSGLHNQIYNILFLFICSSGGIHKNLHYKISLLFLLLLLCRVRRVVRLSPASISAFSSCVAARSILIGTSTLFLLFCSFLLFQLLIFSLNQRNKRITSVKISLLKSDILNKFTMLACVSSKILPSLQFNCSSRFQEPVKTELWRCVDCCPQFFVYVLFVKSQLM